MSSIAEEIERLGGMEVQFRGGNIGKLSDTKEVSECWRNKLDGPGNRVFWRHSRDGLRD
jgi:hypothetical protein